MRLNTLFEFESDYELVTNRDILVSTTRLFDGRLYIGWFASEFRILERPISSKQPSSILLIGAI